MKIIVFILTVMRAFAADSPESMTVRIGTNDVVYLRADRLYFTNLITSTGIYQFPTNVAAELPPPPPTNCEMRLNYLESYIQQLRPSKVPVPSLYDFVAVSNRMVALEKVMGEGLPRQRRYCPMCGARIGD